VVIYYGGKVQAMGTLQELLATPDAVRITTPTLPRATMERVLETIRQDVAADKVRIDTPTQNLESYFLDVVAKARARAAETSGATGGKVAAYLQGDAQPQPSPDRILERLTAPASQSAPVSAREATPPSVNEEKLASLAKPEASRPVEPVAPPEQPADLSKANEKLNSLLPPK
jgi:hypothetical protein